ncbi:hypothetical protein RAS2_29890 [Phycisphaerae bacterium RAS2]|nr:hypothetical protein RAS2_29890 [Phycisphaerae bacterium RAS2]
MPIALRFLVNPEQDSMRLTLRIALLSHHDVSISDVEQRVRMAFGRFGDLIRRIDVALESAKGPREAGRWCCRATVLCKSGPAVRADFTDIDPVAAIYRAIDRAARHVRNGAIGRRTSGHE